MCVSMITMRAMQSVDYNIPHDRNYFLIPRFLVVVSRLLLLFQQSGLLSSGTEQISHPRDQPRLITFTPFALQ